MATQTSTVPTALESAIGMIDLRIADMTDERDLLAPYKVRGLLHGYDARWSNAPYVPDAVEQLVTSELWNPETGKRSRTFRIAGKLDSTGYSGRRVVIDHKTTSQDITDFNSAYWRQLAIDGQVSHYMLLEWLNGRKVDEAVWDVMRKPSISPKTLSKSDQNRIAVERSYFGTPISDDDLQQMVATGRETLAMYSYRLAHDCTTERPQWYFQRRTVARVDADIHEYASELWEVAQDIIATRRLARWTRNPGACVLYNTPCKFLPICSGHDTPESENWKRKAQVHVELDELTGDGRDVLTTSRVRCFQTCRRKHFYAYEMGIDRHDDEDSEALRFGTLWHEALRVWFESKKGEQQ